MRKLLHGRQQNAQRRKNYRLSILQIHELPGNFGEVGEDGLPQHYMAAGDIAISKTGEFIAASVRGHYEIVILRVLPDGRMELASRLPVQRGCQDDPF